MTGQVVSHYRVLDQIGGGAMGVVYRAQDLRLGRQVALKFLPPELSRVPAALERFQREAESVSSLNHPHICTLFDIGEHDGRQFLVLELLEGRPLKQVIGEAPLAVPRVIALASELADALDAAHAKGIVHRDVKPGNILITLRGSAKLLDFGIATARVNAGVATDGDVTRGQLTTPGDWIGTPDYMAPEQVRGEVADVRSDLFSLGAVMFEMATGRTAFGAKSPGASMDAVLHKRPARPSQINPDVPAELERIIFKALEKDPALRYQTASELLADLRRLARDTQRADSTVSATTSARLPRALSSRLLAAAAIIVFAIAVVGLAWLATRDREDPLPPLVAAGTGQPARLVVLPFENLTRNTDDDWLAGAFSDSVSAGLQGVEALILVPRERVVELYAAESHRESAPLSSDLARQLSRKLRVRFYVHGSYQKLGDNLRVVARLVDVEADAVEAQETVTGQFTNVLQLEGLLASRLAARLNPNAPVSTGPDATQDLDAYQLVTEARALYALGRFADARPLLRRAVDRDPRYALAWALLSKTDSRLASPAVSSGRPSPELLETALEEARTGVDLSPNLVETQIALALAHRGLNNRPRMREAAQQAVALDTRHGEARVIVGDSFSISPGSGCPTDSRPDVAEAEFREGIRLDPLLGGSYLNLTTLLWWMDRKVEALAVIEEGLTAQPGNLLLTTSRPFNMVFANRLDEAEALLRERTAHNAEPTSSDTLTWGYLALRRKNFTEAAARFKTTEAQQALNSLAWRLITAVAHFEAGRETEGAAHLAGAVSAEPSCAQWAITVPALAPYRSSAKFVAALGGDNR